MFYLFISKDFIRHKYREKDRIRALTSAILPSYAPINHQPVRLDVTYDVIGNPPLPLRHRRPRVTANVTTRGLGLHTISLLSHQRVGPPLTSCLRHHLIS